MRGNAAGPEAVREVRTRPPTEDFSSAVQQRLPWLDRVSPPVMIAAAVPLHGPSEKPRGNRHLAVTVCSGQQCQLAHGGPRFQFRECFRPLG
jgi:hypothetical protein